MSCFKILEVAFNDETKVIVKRIPSNPEDTSDKERGLEKLQSEALLLRWMPSCSDIPVPRISFLVDDSSSRNCLVGCY